MNQIEEWMNSRIGLNFRSGLDRMKQAVSLLGRPDKAYTILHVTGTNGKGSTIAFMRQLLMAHGKKVGTFTSPHMISIHDRICIGDKPISDEDFTRIGQEVQQMEQTLLQTQDSLILKLSASWLSCILRNKQLMWSYWKLVSVDFSIPPMW